MSCRYAGVVWRSRAYGVTGWLNRIAADGKQAIRLENEAGTPHMVQSKIMRISAMLAAIPAALLLATPAQANSVKPVPYWASISEPEARMRVGPNLDYPSNWIYRRRDLPVKVVKVLGNWRKIEDSSGVQGWMHVRLLSDTATAIVTGSITEMRERAGDDGKLLYRVQPGVVGRVKDCGSGWCALDVGGRKGFVRTASLWGAVE
ncbi:hypothetical protein BH11PSE5_BH11PSE5_25620 [soil metagenome]|nr:hypothetical protein SPH9361_02374 [Sphingobium sp. CECT 9361]